MSDIYYTNYTYDEVTDILDKIKMCVTNDRYIFSQGDSRKENIEFIADYGLSETERKNILLRIETEDFCYGLQNKKPGYEHEVLYVFCPQERLTYGYVTSFVDIYTKFNIVNNNMVVVISFHKRNHPIDYLFGNKSKE